MAGQIECFFERTADKPLADQLAEAGINNSIGPAALFPIRQLAGENSIELFLRDAKAREYAAALNPRRGGDNPNQIAIALAANFVEQRDIQHHHTGAAGLLLFRPAD